MPVGEFAWPDVKAVEGIRLSAVAADIKNNGSGRLDLALIEICEGAELAAVFTRNAFCAEPVKICREHLAQSTSRSTPTPQSKPKYLLINSGNANACTGQAGYQAAQASCAALAQEAQASIEQVLPFSTGVIGELLPAKNIIANVPEALAKLSKDAWHDVARAMMTTDTRAKGWSEQVQIDGSCITVTGVAKGAGMIKPNMGTMLAYVATDANISQALLADWVHDAANQSFNRITVDGDTSTNDALVLMATAKAAHAPIHDAKSEAAKAVQGAINRVCQKLALEMVRDAEGATKCVRVSVNGGATAQESLDVAYAICHSPLVKTALFASDPNWGRIVAAIGYAGIEDLDPSQVSVWLDDVSIVAKGERAASYTEAQGQRVFDQSEFTIRVALGRGSITETLWTSDLSHDYVKINAEYRT